MLMAYLISLLMFICDSFSMEIVESVTIFDTLCCSTWQTIFWSCLQLSKLEAPLLMINMVQACTSCYTTNAVAVTSIVHVSTQTKPISASDTMITHCCSHIWHQKLTALSTTTCAYFVEDIYRYDKLIRGVNNLLKVRARTSPRAFSEHL